MQLKAQDGSVIVSGNLGKDAEYKRVGEMGYDLTTFSLAIGKRADESGNMKSVWVDVNCWRERAFQAMGLKKGDSALVVGTLDTQNYTARDGTNKTRRYINAEMVIGVPKASYQPLVQEMQPAPPPVDAGVSYDEYNDLGDLPF